MKADSKLVLFQACEKFTIVEFRKKAAYLMKGDNVFRTIGMFDFVEK